MSQAIHADGKIWIAPFSPGFDARLVGGTKSVDRKDGATLVTQYQASVQSSPDVIGLISWNEFSENTHVEPSVQFGDRYLTVLRDLLVTQTAPTYEDLGDSSSSPAGDTGDLATNIILLTVFVVGLFSAISFLVWRRRRRESWPPRDMYQLQPSRTMAPTVGRKR